MGAVLLPEHGCVSHGGACAHQWESLALRARIYDADRYVFASMPCRAIHYASARGIMDCNTLRSVQLPGIFNVVRFVLLYLANGSTITRLPVRARLSASNALLTRAGSIN